MGARHLAIVGGVALFGACTGRDAARPGDDAGAACQPVAAERGQCLVPLDTTLCAATWETRVVPMCGLRVYEGPGAGYLLQYVSYNDVPPVGGPSFMCVYDSGTRALAGAWALDHYLRWCCGSSFDLFQGVATNEIADLAVSMATHPACPDAGT